jgi:hypothetical protein
MELGGDPNQARVAFEQAATALEAIMEKGNRAEADRDFHFVIAAASYHLAHLSAWAYSLLGVVAAEENFSPIEQALALLMRRGITELRAQVYAFRLDGRGSDATIAALFQQRLAEPVAADAAERCGRDFLFEGLDLALTDAFFGALVGGERGDTRPLILQTLHIPVEHPQGVVLDLGCIHDLPFLQWGQRAHGLPMPPAWWRTARERGAS